MTADGDAVSAPMPEPRINLLVVATTLWIGGAEMVIQHLAQTIDRSRFNLVVCCLKQRGCIGDDLARSGIDIVGIQQPDRTRVDYLSFLKLLRVIRARRTEVVHTHTAQGLTDACLCKLLTPGLKVVHTFHFGNYPHTRARILWMERIFARLADRLISVGDAQKARITSVFRLPAARIDTIWNGVNLPRGTGDAAFCRQLGAGGRIVIGTVATLIPQKGLFDLLDVAKRIIDSGRPALFVVVGEGQLRAELERKRSLLGLDDAVIMPGWVTDAAQRAFPALDIFFQPSHWEAMSVVILEAMAAGKPVVATEVGENSRVIAHGVDGLLAPPRNLEAMTEALGRLIDDEPLRRRLGGAARRKVEERFTVSRMTREYERVYRVLVR